MSNWTQITSDDLTGAKYAAVINTATAQGWNMASAILSVSSRVRAAISTGNQLDAVPTKIPNSLKDLALRMILRLAKNSIEMPLSEDERAERREDTEFLDQITKQKIRFEEPDTPAGSAEMQEGEGLQTITRTDRREYTRRGMDGL